MSRVIDAVLRLQDDFTAPMSKAVQAMTNGSKSAVKIGRDIEKTGKIISGVGLGMTAAITLPLVAFGKTAVSAAGNYDQSVRLIKATMGDTKYAAADLEAAMENAAKSSVFTLQETADATLAFARAGFDAQEASEMLTPALSLAAGTATDLSDVTSGMTATMKTFSDEGITASEVANVFATAQAQAATDTNQLFEAVSTAGPLFNTLGWSVKDLATATDIFGDAGISGSEGATAMKTSLMRLASKADTLKGMGAEIFDDQGNLKSMVDVQKELHEAFGQLKNDSETLEMLDDIFGKNQGAKMMSFINADPEKVQEYRQALEDCSDTAKTMADAMMSGLGGTIETLGSTFDVFKIKVGGMLGETVQPFIQGITSLLNKFLDLDETQQKNIVKFATYAAAAGPVILIFGKLVSAIGVGIQMFNKIKTVLTGVSTAAKVFGVACSAPMAVVVAAIAAVVAVVAVVATHFDMFKQAASNAFATIAPAVQNLASVISNLFTAASPIISAIGDLFAVVLCGAIQGAASGISTAIDSIAGFIQGLSETVSGIVETIKSLLEGDFSGAWESAKETVSGVIETMSSIINGLLTPVNTIIGAIKGIGSGVSEASSSVGAAARTTSRYGGAGRGATSRVGRNASGTTFWHGGLTSINERGGEIIDLPRGSRVYPHDESVAMARAEGSRQTNISIPKLADQIVVREEADIEKIGERLANRISAALGNTGGYSFSGNMA